MSLPVSNPHWTRPKVTKGGCFIVYISDLAVQYIDRRSFLTTRLQKALINLTACWQELIFLGSHLFSDPLDENIASQMTSAVGKLPHTDKP